MTEKINNIQKEIEEVTSELEKILYFTSDYRLVVKPGAIQLNWKRVILNNELKELLDKRK